MEEVAQPALGAHVRVAVRRVGDRTVDDARDAGVGEHRYALAGVEDLRLEAVEVGGPQLVGELVGDAVEPHRGRLPLVRAEDVAVALLAQVVRRVGVAQERQLVGERGELGDLLGDEVLVRHRHDRQVAAEERHDLAGAVAGGVDHDLALGAGLGVRGARGDDPSAVGALLETDHALGAADARAHRAGAARHRLRHLRGVDVAIERVPQRALEVVGAQQRVALEEPGGREDLVLHAVGARHGRDVVELGHPFAAVREAHRAGDVVRDGELGVGGELAEEVGRVLLDLHHAPGPGERRHVAGRVPRGPARELVPLEEEGVGAAAQGEVVQRADARDPAADDDHSCALRHVRPPPRT